MHGATQTDHKTTPAKVVEDPPNPITSQSQSSPVIINETSDHQSRRCSTIMSAVDFERGLGEVSMPLSSPG